MADKIKNIKGSLILLLAAFIWGTAFVAQTSGADSVGTFTFNTCRSVVGALFLLLVIVLLDIATNKIMPQSTPPFTGHFVREYGSCSVSFPPSEVRFP